MKSDDNNIVSTSVGFNANHTFTTDGSQDFLSVLVPELNKLGTGGNTVIITDSYLFNIPTNQPNYVSNLKTLLLSLNAKAIIHSGYTPRDAGALFDIQSALSAKGCSFTINDSITPPYHSRYWICIETKKGIITDTSLNGFQTKRSYVHNAPTDEIESVMTSFGFSTDAE